MKAPPLLILGMDTGDVELIQRWVAEGRLPTLASLMERGCWGHTAGPDTVCEYGFSLTLFSGVSRADHGYYYVRQLKSGTYDLQNVEPRDVGALPFWSELRGHGRKALVLDVPDIDPVPGLAGMQITNWGTHHGSKEDPVTDPPELLAEVERIFGPRIVLRGKPEGTVEEDRVAYRTLLKRVERKGHLARELLGKDDFDAAVIFICDTDPASHYFWKYRPEAEHTHARYRDDDELRHGIRDVYAAVDAEFGRILASVPDETNVAVVSLYSIQDEYPTSTLIESFCRELGYHVPRPKAAAKRSIPGPLDIARKILPKSVRVALSRRLPASAQESLLAGQLRDHTDWSRTTAFAVPSLYTSFVYVNLRGREPEGIVEPGAPYEALLDRFEDDLMQLVDPVTGRRAVKKVSRSTRLFGRGVPRGLPDLWVEWEPVPHFVERVVHPRATLVQPRPHYCPDNQERMTGFVALAGPSVESRGPVGEIELLDLAPTFLALMGHDAPPTAGGRVRDDLVRRPAAPRGG